MLWQSGMLVVILLGVDYILRRKVSRSIALQLWMLVIVKLVLPTSLSSPVSIGQFIVPASLVKISRAIRNSQTATFLASSFILTPQPE